MQPIFFKHINKISEQQSTVNSTCATGRRLIRSIIRDGKYSNLLQTFGNNLSGTHFEIRCDHPSRNTSTGLTREENGLPFQQVTGLGSLRAGHGFKCLVSIHDSHVTLFEMSRAGGGAGKKVLSLVKC